MYNIGKQLGPFISECIFHVMQKLDVSKFHIYFSPQNQMGCGDF